MSRHGLVLVLTGLLVLPASAFADGKSSSTSSTTKKVAWTVVGAGAGLAAGVFLGLAKFDDAINSDRKVLTTAIACAVAGGVAGALIGRRNVGRNVPVTRRQPPTPSDSLDVTWESALGTRR